MKFDVLGDSTARVSTCLPTVKSGPPQGRHSRVSDALWTDFIARSGAIDLTGAVRTGERPNPIGFDGLHWSAEGNRRATEAKLEHAQLARR